MNVTTHRSWRLAVALLALTLGLLAVAVASAASTAPGPHEAADSEALLNPQPEHGQCGLSLAVFGNAAGGSSTLGLFPRVVTPDLDGNCPDGYVKRERVVCSSPFGGGPVHCKTINVCEEE